LLFLVGLPLLSLSRAALMLWQAERVAATGIWPEMLLQGIRVDLIQLSLFALPLLLLAPLLATRPLWPLWRRLSTFWVLLAFVVLTLLEVSSPPFISEYDSRPNRLFVEYLKYPAEVSSMLWTGFRLQVIVGSLLTVLAGLGMARLLRPWRQQPMTWAHWQLWLSWPLVVLVCALTIRSSLDHRPANPAMFALTGDPMVNTLILNSAWSVTHAVYGLSHEARSSDIYGQMAAADILAELHGAAEQRGDQRPAAGDGEIPTLIAQSASRHRERPLNLVIVLQESLGATFVESLGGVPVTPELEKLKSQGWWFEQLYATGTRSIRGIEAVVTGFPPTPAQAVVKLQLAQRNFASLASILGRHGYESEFIYGGEAHFDNMRGFFTNSGFNRVTEEKD
jgi:phosphoglycerol transferase MdoB-like AlkP superfamily enzyme